MSREWNEFVAALGDLLPGGVPVLGLLLFVLTVLVAALWYWWPGWLPHRWFRWSGRRRGTVPSRRRWRLRRPRLGRLRFRFRWGWWRRRRPTPPPAELPGDEVPDLPAVILTLSADELAAAGNHREAVRERLRAIVRDLIERQVIAPRPGWTVTELAGVAGRARPAAAGPLRAASDLFSDIWYGQRPATAEDDRSMRTYGEQVRAAVAPPAGTVPMEGS